MKSVRFSVDPIVYRMIKLEALNRDITLKAFVLAAVNHYAKCSLQKKKKR